MHLHRIQNGWRVAGIDLEPDVGVLAVDAPDGGGQFDGGQRLDRRDRDRATLGRAD